ncbi:MAG: radical SAM protein, partial [Pseudomonadota bacterium]
PTVIPSLLYELIEVLKARHAVSSVSVETNPDDLGKASIGMLADAGVTRLSVGVQSFDDDLLKQMQRYEKYGSGQQIQAAIKGAAACFDTLNIDMIFNFPRQTEASLKRDLSLLTDELGVDQVSYYPLMNVDNAEGTMEKAMGRVEYSRERQFYDLIAEHMLAAGYTRNSSWCFSRESGMFDEYIVDREQYVGLGSGSFSYLDGSLYSSTFSIGDYGRMVADGRSGTVFSQALSERDQRRYYLLMQLFGGRLDKRQAEQRFNGGFERGLWRELTALQVIGAVRDRGTALELTERGHYLWVVMMREFFSGVNRLRDRMRHTNGAGEAQQKAGEGMQ